MYAGHTACVAIKTWACERTRAVFEGESPNVVPRDVLARANRKLLMIDAATDVLDLRSPPGNRLERLRGDREGQYSIRVNKQYRVCFVWRGGDAYQVEIVDYHRG
jgi:toxin HigB-1